MDTDLLDRLGVLWAEGRADYSSGEHLDCTDIALQLNQFSAETASHQQGSAVDRKPHQQRMSADFGGGLHDPGERTRLGGRHTQAMLTGLGPGATGLRQWWQMIDGAVADTCSGSKLIQMFVMVATGQGIGATTGEPHADFCRCRETRQPIGARGTIHLTADPAAAREFRMAIVELQDSGDKSLRIASDSLQQQVGADGRKHLPVGPHSISRQYRNLDVSLLNAEGLGVVAARDGSQTGHEGGLAPLGGVPLSGQCTMHGAIVFSLSSSPLANEMSTLVARVTCGASKIRGGMRYSDPPRWLQIKANHGAELIQTIKPRRKRPPRTSATNESLTEIVAVVIGYNGSAYRGSGADYDAGWSNNDSRARQSYGADTVEGQLFGALDRVRRAAGVVTGDSLMYAESGRPPVYSNAARTDRGVDAMCNVLALPLEKTLLQSCSVAELVERVNEQLPADILCSHLFGTCWGFNAKQFCEYRHYEMLLPLCTIPQAAPSQRTIWAIQKPGAPWEKRSIGPRGLAFGGRLVDPLTIDEQSSSCCFEWTMRRALRGQSAPMVRVAILVQRSADSEPQWLVSASGERVVHAAGACVEYFGCGAVAAEEQWELRTLRLDQSTVWRKLHYNSLELEAAEPCRVCAGTKVLAAGVWCDGTALGSLADERSPHGSSKLRGTSQQRTEALGALLPHELELIQSLVPGGECMVSLGLQHADGGALSKASRVALCTSIRELNHLRRCTVVKHDGRRCLQVVHEAPGAAAEGSTLCPWQVLQIGMTRVVQLNACNAPVDPSPNDDQMAATEALPTCAASAVTMQLTPLLNTVQGDHSFHNFSPHLTSSQKRCRRNMSCAACSSFLLQWVNNEWQAHVVLTFTAKAFLFHQIEHLVGCIVMVISGFLPERYLHDALQLPSERHTPHTPPGALLLASCSYNRKIERPDAAAVWVGARATGGVGMQQGFVANVPRLLDWRSSLHKAQAHRIYHASDSWWAGLVRQASSVLLALESTP